MRTANPLTSTFPSHGRSPGAEKAPAALLLLPVITAFVLLLAIGAACGASTSAPLSTPRWGGVAAPLANGTILVAGGWDGNVDVATAEVFDPATGAWHASASMSLPREFAVMEPLADGRVLVAGGADWRLGIALSSAEVFDSERESWTSIRPMAFPHADTASVRAPDGSIVVIGGSDGVVRHAHVEILDPSLTAWRSLADLNVARSGHVAALLSDGRIFVAGGVADEGLALFSAEIYDFGTNRWTLLPPMSAGRLFATAVPLAGGRVLVAGGTPNDFSLLASSEIFDPSTGSWSAGGALSEARYGALPVSLPGGDVLLVSGWADGQESRRTDRVNRVTGSVTSDLILDVPRSFPAVAISAGGTMLVAGGMTVFETMSTTEVHAIAIGPAVVDDPRDTVVCQGGSGSFWVNASGTPPLSYQWSSDGAPIAGATSNVYFVSNAGAADARSYACTVSNPFGSAQSAGARLLLGVTPSASAGADASTGVGVSITLRGNAFDCLDCTAAWSIVSNPGLAGILSSNASLQPNFQASAPGSYVCRLVVTSAAGCASSPSDVSITVLTASIPSLSSFVIAGGAATTASALVTLDAVVSGNPTFYMAAADARFKNGVWLPFTATPTFSLTGSSGKTTLYFKVRNDLGESGVLSDTIGFQPAVTVVGLAINAGKNSTTTANVTLNNSVAGAPTHYLASEDPKFTGAAWQAYSTAPQFTLSSGNGTKTVYFKVRSNSDESTIKSDGIKLSSR